MEQIHKFIECLIPVTACNLKCSYCYVMQENRRSLQIPNLNYSLDTIQYALRKERFGGTCYFSICGAGETMLPQYMVELIRRILENGHYVNVTSNGTVTARYEEMCRTIPPKYLKRLHCAFSLHYIELERRHLTDTFFSNVKKMKDAGCSIVVQLNMCDEYMPLLDEIKARCMEELGALPQVAVTRKESGFPVKRIELYTAGSEEAYIQAGKGFESPLFDYTLKNFLKHRKEFCYAGDWSYQLNLQNGLLKRCYCSCVVQNIFKDPEKKLMHLAVGHACNSLYCNNSSHFMALGVIPELDGPSYAELRDRPQACWYSPEMRGVLGAKLSQTNAAYGKGRRLLSGLVGIYDKLAYTAYEFLLSQKSKRKAEHDKETADE